mmetsp:Transcript_61915/g.182898  ORF Transcript_61915/g.182898 Transcript_61915/m.182898 type:complete len:86 (+) Transcript_61915:308-565(+)
MVSAEDAKVTEAPEVVAGGRARRADAPKAKANGWDDPPTTVSDSADDLQKDERVKLAAAALSAMLPVALDAMGETPSLTSLQSLK